MSLMPIGGEFRGRDEVSMDREQMREILERMREGRVEERTRDNAEREYQYNPWNTGLGEKHQYRVGQRLEVARSWCDAFNEGDRVEVIDASNHDGDLKALYQVVNMKNGQTGICHTTFLKCIQAESYFEEDLFTI